MSHLDDVLARLKTLHPLLIDLSLGRIERLLAKLGDPQLRLPPVIHVAGTNGKGSVTAMLRAILESAGKRVHVYTSPHLVRFAERIALATATPDGPRALPIEETRLAALFERVEVVNGADPMTFFEITTAAAFVAFAETPADIVLLEVGLGGRLDATNVIARPRLTVVMPVSIDHAEKLGDTVAKIAFEKAGILKRGVTGIVARQDDAAREVIEDVAAKLRAPLKIWGQDYETFEQSGRLVFQAEERLLDLPLPALIGSHQIANAGAAIAAVLELSELGIDDSAIAAGLRAVEWPARMQRLSSGPLTALLQPGSELWLDGGHNPAGAAALAETLVSLEERLPKPLALVVGLMGQKDAKGYLSCFKGLAASVTAVPIPGAHEAPHAPEAIATIASSLGFVASVAPDAATAISRIEADGPPRRFLICGSLYLAGHVLALQRGLQVQGN